ncbi:c-type cytochrome [Devosia beringensis]|uniref:c-type cytochrome n=1 Tax=Devosia beringensis TaxID=2657486 RepID=UPI001E29B8E8|nr:cytochrome c [Devosia beringensis]
MLLKKITALTLAGFMTLGAVASFAQDAFVAPTTPEAAVAAREVLMKSNGATLKAAGALTGAEASAAMQTLLDNFTNMAAVFPEGSITGDSKASPAIWQDWAGFTAIIDTGKAAATAGLAAAETGDATAYGAALKAIGATCGTCHEQYRLK